MNVKLESVLALNSILNTLSNQKMSLRASNCLFCLEEAIKPQLTFKQEKLKEIIADFGLTPDDNGIVHFESTEIQNQVQNKLNELYDLEVEINWTPKTISLDEQLSVSPAEISILKDFITFE